MNCQVTSFWNKINLLDLTFPLSDSRLSATSDASMFSQIPSSFVEVNKGTFQINE